MRKVWFPARIPWAGCGRMVHARERERGLTVRELLLMQTLHHSPKPPVAHQYLEVSDVLTLVDNTYCGPSALMVGYRVVLSSCPVWTNVCQAARGWLTAIRTCDHILRPKLRIHLSCAGSAGWSSADAGPTIVSAVRRGEHTSRARSASSSILSGCRYSDRMQTLLFVITAMCAWQCADSQADRCRYMTLGWLSTPVPHFIPADSLHLWSLTIIPPHSSTVT